MYLLDSEEQTTGYNNQNACKVENPRTCTHHYATVAAEIISTRKELPLLNSARTHRSVVLHKRNCQAKVNTEQTIAGSVTENTRQQRKNAFLARYVFHYLRKPHKFSHIHLKHYRSLPQYTTQTCINS